MRHIFNQRGQIPGGFATGGLWAGLGQGFNRLADMMLEKRKMDEESKERKLRQQMLDLQMNKMLREQEEAMRQQQAVDMLASQFEQPQPFVRPPGVEGPLLPSGAFGETPGDPRMAAMIRAQPKEAVTGLLRQELQPQQQAGLAFATPQEATAFQQTPEYKALFPSGSRTIQTSRGFQFEGVNPVNVASNVYHSVLAATGSQAAAQAAYQDTLFKMGATQRAGGELGAAAAITGQPVPPAPPFAGQTAPPQAPQAGQQPQISQQPRPTPSGGPSQSLPLQAAREKARIAREERPLDATMAGQISALQTMLQTTLPNIRSNFNIEFLGPVRGTDITFEARRQIGSVVGSPVSGQETTFRTALRDAGDQLLRARSGAQINEQEYQRLRAILPKATDEPQVFMAALDRFENELKAMLEQKRRIVAEPRGAAGARQSGTALPPPPPGWR